MPQRKKWTIHAYFENLEIQQKEILLKSVTLFEGELPVIGSVESEDKWTFITTARIMWRSQNETVSLDEENIRDVIANFQKLMTVGCRKNQMRELVVLTFSGEQHILDMEEGPPLIGVWSVLKNCGARNRISTHIRE